MPTRVLRKDIQEPGGDLSCEVRGEGRPDFLPWKEASVSVGGLGPSRGHFGHLRREWPGQKVGLGGPRSEPNLLLMVPHLYSF